MADLIIGTKWLTMVLMDGGSGLNILYTETLDTMGIDRARIRPTTEPFHGIVSGKQVVPLGQIDLPITFRDLSNYRIETLTFEVVRFHGTYHAILGCPCYVKFIAVPNYAYLKLKMSGSCGVITIGTSFQRAYECKSSAVNTPWQSSPPKSSWPLGRRSPKKYPTPSRRPGLLSQWRAPRRSS
ncbi:uncharacterized protein [Miscanthus floridulus]|uniref:uncharacterized protein n=1 Tax=Miscanthus floridulus TaxID=154761 RepID=UPI003459BBC5